MSLPESKQGVFPFYHPSTHQLSTLEKTKLCHHPILSGVVDNGSPRSIIFLSFRTPGGSDFLSFSPGFPTPKMTKLREPLQQTILTSVVIAEIFSRIYLHFDLLDKKRVFVYLEAIAVVLSDIISTFDMGYKSHRCSWLNWVGTEKGVQTQDILLPCYQIKTQHKPHTPHENSKQTSFVVRSVVGEKAKLLIGRSAQGILLRQHPHGRGKGRTMFRRMK